MNKCCILTPIALNKMKEKKNLCRGGTLDFHIVQVKNEQWKA